jgi:hypothetical protein
VYILLPFSPACLQFDLGIKVIAVVLTVVVQVLYLGSENHFSQHLVLPTLPTVGRQPDQQIRHSNPTLSRGFLDCHPVPVAREVGVIAQYGIKEVKIGYNYLVSL